MKNTIKIAIIFALFPLLTACGFNTNPPSVQSYINKPMAFSNDMGIQEYSSWAGDYISFFTINKNTLKKVNDPQSRQWKTVWLGQRVRIIGVAHKGDLYQIDKFYEPQFMSDGAPYAIITVLSGPAKGTQGKIMPDDLGKFKKYYYDQLYRHNS